MNKCARDEKWEKIEADYGTEVATALRMLYDYLQRPYEPMIGNIRDYGKR